MIACVCPGSFTTSMPSSLIVNVCGESFAAFTIESVSPCTTFTVEGVNSKSVCVTVTVAAWLCPVPSAATPTSTAKSTSAAAQGRASCFPRLMRTPSSLWETGAPA